MRILLLSILYLFSIVSVYSQTITSINSGSWNSTSTWDCTCVPTSTDDVVISSGDIVNLSVNTTVNNFTIQLGGTLNQGTKDFVVDGNYFNSGTHSATGGGDLSLNGVSTTIDGVGIVNIARPVTIEVGNKTISSSADLSFVNGNLVIGNGLIVTNNGELTTLVLNGGNASSTFVNNGQLNVGDALMNTGILIANSSGNTVNFYQAGNQTIKTPQASTYHHVTISGTGTKTLSGTLTLNGNLTISSGTLDVSTSNFGLTILGDFVNQGTFTERSGTVSFNGSASQNITTISVDTFFVLTIANSAGIVTSNNNIAVKNQLNFTQGILDMSGNKLTLGTSALNIGTLVYSSGRIIGSYEKWINAAGSHTMPIGNLSYATPSLFSISGLTSSGSVIAVFNSTPPVNNGFPLEDAPDSLFNVFNEGYWTLTTANSLVVSAYNISLTGNGFSSYTINPSTRVVSKSTASSNWTVAGTHASASGSTCYRNGLSILPADFAFADTTNCTAPSIPTISGTNSVCTNEAGVVYSAVNNPGSTYTWTVNGGNITSGQGSSSITVTWGATAMAGSVSVTENNGCANSAPGSYSVSINTIAPTEIIGSFSVIYSTTKIYSVESIAGYTYNWSVIGGSISSGQGTNTITVAWGATPGTGQVCVTANSSCGNSTQFCEDVAILTVINSVGTGGWDAAATWDCSCVPTSTDNVRIKSLHTVTLGSATTINHLVVESSATLFDNAKNLIVTGDATIDGNYIGSRVLEIRGSGNVISGSGTIAHTGDFLLTNGSKSFDASANIIRSPGNINIGNSIVVSNSGSVNVSGAIIGGNASSTWVNDENSTLTIGGALLATGGVFAASAEGNTVAYNGTVGQTIYNTSYYNLSSTGTNTVSLNTNTVIQGDISIAATGTFNSNNFNLTVGGSWINSGGTFNAGTSTVTFNGTGTQTISKTGGETFNNLKINKTAGVAVLGSNITINGNLEITSGTLDPSASNYNIDVNGNFTNNGTLTYRENTLIMSGAGAQLISGTASPSLYNLTINSAGVTSSSNINLFNTLTLTSGTFNVGTTTFTLKSSAASTARIAEITGGAFSGNITMERYAPASSPGFRFVSVPVSTGSVASWSDDFYTTGFTGSNEPANTYKSIYYYDETVTGVKENGWKGVTSTADGVSAGVGHTIYDYSGAATVFESSGPPVTGNVPFTIDYTSSGGELEDGWNLVGNPYPCEIDWDAAGWTKTLMNDAVYIWDPAQQQYATYVNGSGTLGGSRYIGSSQAFWVQASAAGAALEINENCKAESAHQYFKMDLSNNLKLEVVATNGKKDETVIRFDKRTNRSFDGKYDARKVFSTNANVPNISTFDSTGADLSINSYGDFKCDVTIPLRIKRTGVTGNLTINVVNENLPEASGVYLEDLVTGNIINLRTTPSYTFYFVKTTSTPRFNLIIRPIKDIDYLLERDCWRYPISKPESIKTKLSEGEISPKLGSTAGEEGFVLSESDVKIFPNPSNGKKVWMFIENGNEEQNLYTIADLSGKTVLSGSTNQTSTEIELENVSPGIYLLTVSGKSSSVVKKLIVSE